jgi:hypothetical protein
MLSPPKEGPNSREGIHVNILVQSGSDSICWYKEAGMVVGDAD